MRYVTEKEAWNGLAAAIVGKAAEDYVNAHLFSTVDGKKSEYVIEEVEHFFLSDDLHMYTKADGQQIIDALKAKANKIICGWAKQQTIIPERYSLHTFLED